MVKLKLKCEGSRIVKAMLGKTKQKKKNRTKLRGLRLPDFSPQDNMALTLSEVVFPEIDLHNSGQMISTKVPQ